MHGRCRAITAVRSLDLSWPSFADILHLPRHTPFYAVLRRTLPHGSPVHRRMESENSFLDQALGGCSANVSLDQDRPLHVFTCEGFGPNIRKSL